MGVAVGAGTVWATAEGEGLVWRVERGPDPITRTIDVGGGVTSSPSARGDLDRQLLDGTVARIDVETNEVTESTPWARCRGSPPGWAGMGQHGRRRDRGRAAGVGLREVQSAGGGTPTS